MNDETYEQTFIKEEIINAPQFLKEGDYAEIYLMQKKKHL